ncbi:MAG: murein biosynthesis integral membrane protein MurJ [Patescibacteria group bacterium]
MTETDNLSTPAKITKGAVIIGLFSICSRLLGLFRDRLLAANFGAGDTLDAYYAAFKIPDFVFNILVLGGLASAFIPVFIELKNRKGMSEAWQVVNIIFNILFIVLSVCAVVAIIFANDLVPLIAPGFNGEKLALTVQLTRIMMLAVIFFGISNVFSVVLNSFKRFLVYSLAPVLYNVGIIGGIIFLVPWLGLNGLAIGVLAGSVMHMLIQLPSVWQLGWRWSLCLQIFNQSVRKIVRLILPRTFGLAVHSFNQIVISIFASTLAGGSLAAFTLALNLQTFPINVFGVSLAIAAFPLFSEAWSNNKPENLIDHLSISIRKVLFFTIPISILFLLLRAQIVRVVLGSGIFSWDDTIRTAQVFGLLALSLVAESLLPLVARAFYALQDTKTPVLVSTVSLVINIILSWLLIKPFGLTGLAFAYVVAGVINFSLLIILLGDRLGDLKSKYIIATVFKIIQAAIPAGLVTYALLQLVAPLVNMHTFVGIFIQGLVSGCGGIICYIVLANYLKLEEVKFFNNLLSTLWLKLKVWI